MPCERHVNYWTFFAKMIDDPVAGGVELAAFSRARWEACTRGFQTTTPLRRPSSRPESHN